MIKILLLLPFLLIGCPKSKPPVTTLPPNALTDGFNGPGNSIQNFLITNEYAFWSPEVLGVVVSDLWEMTSGSFFYKDGNGWSGIPDSKYVSTDLYSKQWNNSDVFRLTSKRSDFQDVEISFKIKNMGFSEQGKASPEPWYGLHVFAGYLSQHELYYVSFNRYDHKIVIKRKIPIGPSNNGTYYDLTAYVPRAIPYNEWQNIKVIKRGNDQAVSITLFINGSLALEAIDKGIMHEGIVRSPITTPGKVGIRGDYTQFYMDDFKAIHLIP